MKASDNQRGALVNRLRADNNYFFFHESLSRSNTKFRGVGDGASSISEKAYRSWKQQVPSEK